MPAFITILDDPYSRLISHACAAFTNFLEFSESDYVKPYAQIIATKLCQLIQTKPVLVKENAVTTLAMVADKTKGEFIPYFNQTLKFLISYLNQDQFNNDKQFRG